MKYSCVECTYPFLLLTFNDLVSNFVLKDILLHFFAPYLACGSTHVLLFSVYWKMSELLN